MNQEQPLQPAKYDAVPFGPPFLMRGAKSVPPPLPRKPRREMSDQHRKNLSNAMKALWARRGGSSDQPRQQTPESVNEKLRAKQP